MKAFEKLNIAVAGTGYVGLSIAVLLSQHHHVTAVDIVPEKVDLINQKKSPIQDDYIEKYLTEKDLDLTATLDGETAYRDADLGGGGGHPAGDEGEPRGCHGHQVHHPGGLHGQCP